MAQNPASSAYASFRIMGPTLDPLDVTLALRLPADHVHRAGEPRLRRHLGTGVVQAAQGIPETTPAGESTMIGSARVWHSSAFESWTAHVDDRFVVTSYHRDLLELALQRSGQLDRLLASFADLPPLPDDSDSVVYLLPRPADRGQFGRPVPIERMRASVDHAQRLRIWHRQPLPERFDRLNPNARSPEVTELEHGWRVSTIELGGDASWRWVVFQVLAGLIVVI